jgi:hypothetical protein
MLDSTSITEVTINAVLVDTNRKKRWCTRVFDRDDRSVVVGYRCLLTERVFVNSQCTEIRERVVKLKIEEVF